MPLRRSMFHQIVLLSFLFSSLHCPWDFGKEQKQTAPAISQRTRAIPYPDFKESNVLHGFYENYEESLRIYDSLDPKYVGLFEQNYYRQIARARSEPLSEKVRIPKIIHQIWLGGEVPETCKKWMETWQNLEGWEYKLWTDKDLAEFPLYNRDLFNAITNHAEKSDILRLEILYQYGGVYVDTDFACTRPDWFEELHRDFDFYIGIEPLTHGAIYKYHMFKFCNAILASTPGHALMEVLMKNIMANYLAYLHLGVVERTGPSYITRIICEYELQGAHNQRNMYLPCSFFYPFSIYQAPAYFADPLRTSAFFPETAGIHYWMGSWRDDPCSYEPQHRS